MGMRHHKWNEQVSNNDRKIKEKIFKGIDKFINVTKARISRVINQQDYVKCGKIRFERETEFHPGNKIQARNVSSKLIINMSQTIEILTVQRASVYLTIQVKGSLLNNYLDPVRRVRRKVIFYMNNVEILPKCCADIVNDCN